MTGVRGHPGDPHPGGVRQHRGPLLVAGGIQRGLGELEVRGAVVVHDQQSVPGRLDVVLHALAARGHQPRGALGIGGGQQPVLAGQLAADPQHDPVLVPAGPDPDPEPLVGLGQHLGVGADVGAEPVPQHHVRPPRRVGAGVEQVALAGPGDPVRDVGDLVGEQLAGGQVHDLEQEPLVPGDVGRVRQQVPGRRHREGAEGEELLALRRDVGVQQDLLAGDLALDVGRGVGSAGGRGAAVDRVLRALEGAHVVPVGRDVARRRIEMGRVRRHAQVGLLGAGLDLAEDGLGQAGQVAGACLGVGVLGLQVGDHVGVLLVPQPLVRVEELVAVVLPAHRAALGHGRLRVPCGGGLGGLVDETRFGHDGRA